MKLYTPIPTRQFLFRFFVLPLICVIGAFTPVQATTAQTTSEIVRGRVTNDSSKAIAGAIVTITRGPDRLVQSTETDSAGNYSSRFEPGTGDYLVHVASPGYRSARRRVQRLERERDLVADFTLAPDLTLLATVKVTASKPVRASNSVGPFSTEPGSSEGWANGVSGQVLPGSAGDLNAIAGTMPGVTMTPGGPTMLGSLSSANLTTLNGMALPSGSLPRAARLDTRVTGATYDPTRGGFSGANIDTRLSAGSRSFQRRNGYLTLDAPILQSTDAIGRSLGLINGGFRGSLGADGEAVRKVLTYNVALDVGRTVSDPSTLIANDTEAWLRAGISPDSVARLRTVASTIGLPVTGSGTPVSRRRDAVSWLGRLDDVRDSLRTLTLTTFASYSNIGALGFGPLTAPAAGGEQTDRAYGGQFVHSQFVGEGHNMLMQNRVGFNESRQTIAPYLDVPGATVFVRSASDVATNDVAAVQLGGNSGLAVHDARWTAEASNEFIRNARGSKHKFKSQLWVRADGLSQTGRPNALGQYTFNSLQDLESNRPSSFSRTLTQPNRNATAYNGAVALAHQWNKSRWFSMMYGARVEGSMFGNAPPLNTDLNTTLGVRSGIAPSQIHVSPRLGFSYTYSRAKDNGNGMNMGSIGTFYRPLMGYLRGGIGEFRSLYTPGTLADAVAGAGLAGNTLTLNCVGTAVPIPDWHSLTGANPIVPSACADGGGALVERAPSVTLVDPAFDVPRSWRASLNWGSNIGSWLIKMDALGSYDLSLPSTLDANFAGVSHFTLPGEENRPVYVSSGAIDPTTGALSASESRRSTAYGRVSQRTSDLHGYGGQLTTTIQPDVFRFRTRIQMFLGASYTIQSVKQQFRGFDGAGFGDPRVTEWGVGANDARHAIVLQGGIDVPKFGAITLYSRLQSGLPFTPIVQGDINGDGRANDRAFVPNPSNYGSGSAADAATAAQMRALLTAAPPNVRQCLEQQLGTVAGRNSCRGSWTQQLNMQWSPRLPFTVRGRHIAANVTFENPLGGIDQLLHGSDKLRGWGSSAAPDPILLLPRGFNPGTKRFQYDVNPRFGDTRAFRTLSRQPFRVTLDFSLDFSVPYDMQQLRRALEPVKMNGEWKRRSADSIAAVYINNTSNIHRLLLAESDSLFLSKDQINALLLADSVYSAQVRDIYMPLGRFLATQPEGTAGKIALDSVTAATKKYWPLFWAQADSVNKIVTVQQKALLPMLGNITAITPEDRKKSQWYFGYPVPFVHNRPQIGNSR